VTSQGALRRQFQRALERGSVLDALAAARRCADSASWGRTGAVRRVSGAQPSALRPSSDPMDQQVPCRDPDAFLGEARLVTSSRAELAAAPQVALPMLRTLVRTRELVTVQSVFNDFVLLDEGAAERLHGPVCSGMPLSTRSSSSARPAGEWNDTTRRERFRSCLASRNQITSPFVAPSWTGARTRARVAGEESFPCTLAP
jgi:hypothetical protein